MRSKQLTSREPLSTARARLPARPSEGGDERRLNDRPRGFSSLEQSRNLPSPLPPFQPRAALRRKALRPLGWSVGRVSWTDRDPEEERDCGRGRSEIGSEMRWGRLGGVGKVNGVDNYRQTVKVILPAECMHSRRRKGGIIVGENEFLGRDQPHMTSRLRGRGLTQKKMN